MQRQFYTLDVFASQALSGNPLAVVMECDGLNTVQMQKIAAEFNLSETVFVLEPRDPVNTVRIRIFTPVRELPFAGHPTVGTAVLLGLLRARDLMVRRDVGVVIEEGIGNISCTVRHLKGHAAYGSFLLAALPQPAGIAAPAAKIAAALGLKASDIGFDGHVPTLFSAGLPYVCVPVSNRAALDAVVPAAAKWKQAFARHGGDGSVYLYTRETVDSRHAFRTRMFFPLNSIVEDPATGSGAAALLGAIMRFDEPGEGDHTLVLEQGFAMGRPSLITLGLEVAGGSLASASIGGHAVIVSKGTIEV